LKYIGSTDVLEKKLLGLSTVEENGIPGVRVKSVDIRRNTNGESSFLARY
jgi:hypothetical protein